MKRLWISGLLCCIAVFQLSAAEPKTTVLLSGLNNPSGVAIHPTSGEIYVSNSGASEVIKTKAKGGKSKPVITDFGKDVYGKGPMYDIGPLGLGFIDDKMLVVGGGDLPDGEELMRVFDISGKKAQKAADAAHKLGPIEPGEATAKGEGNFYGVAVNDQGIYVTANGDDTKGWILKATIENGKPGKLMPFIKSKVVTGVDAPVGVTLSPEGKLVVGQMGEITVPQDSLLTVYDAESGKMISNAETGLFDITALAYSKSGKLYALDFAWMSTKEGGLFRLDVSEKDGKASVKATKILALDKATAMAFDKDGALYVTVFNTAKEGTNGPSGQLIKIEGDL